jgi:membrane protein
MKPPPVEATVRRAQGALPMAIVRRFVDADLLAQSAALAFYAVLSLAPLLLIVLWLVTQLLPGAQER